MEKSAQTITQQLLYLKKSLKKKRKSQKWQQTIQFYRNNQSFIRNYHILKIIKIVIKPLKSSVLKNCHYLTKLDKLYFQNVDDVKYNDQVRDHINIIKNKMRVIENLLDCYTLALENFITASDPAYFKMVFRKGYHAKHPTKQLLFQPVSVTQEKIYSKDILEHELSSYLKFVSEISIVYNTCILCCQQQNTIIKHFKSADKALYEIFNSSHKFATKRMMYQILKLNFLLKFQNLGQPTSMNASMNKGQTQNQAISPNINNSLGIFLINKIIQLQIVKVQYYFPLQLIHNLYKTHKKQDQARTKHSVMLILRYMYMICLNINNPNLLISHKANIPMDEDIRNYNIEAQIYILMKQILNLNKYIHINFKSEFGKQSLQFITSVIEAYQFRLTQKQKLNDFIFKYFDFQQIRNYGNFPNTKQKIKQNTNIAITKRQEQSRYKNRVINQNHRISNKIINLDRQSSKIKITNLQSMGSKISKLFMQFGSIFNYIEESGSDDQNVMTHQFQRKRRQQIIIYQNKIRRSNQKLIKPPHQNWLVFHNNYKKPYLKIEQVNKKLNDLNEKTARLRSFSETALKNLSKKKTDNIQQNKLQKLNNIYNTYQNYQLQYNLQPLQNKTQSVTNKENYMKQCTKLPKLQKRKQQPIKLHKQYQPISLSDKYDKMSQMILLTNTNKQKNINI